MENSHLPPRRLRNVLIVEPNADLRAAMKNPLSVQAYRVFHVGAGRDAIALLRTLGSPLHLLVTELILPDTNGIVLASQVLTKHPTAKCLITTASCDEIAFINPTLVGRIHFLKKPFGMPAFTAKVRELVYGEPTTSGEARASLGSPSKVHHEDLAEVTQAGEARLRERVRAAFAELDRTRAERFRLSSIAADVGATSDGYRAFEEAVRRHRQAVHEVGEATRALNAFLEPTE